jgi:hypothetical protein
MSDHKAHQSELHTHGPGCKHATIGHRDHEDYLRDGKLEHVHAGTIEIHTLEVNDANPALCTPSHACGGHAAGHQHGPTCEHAAVPHGDHVDYVVNGHLHHPCDRHCDDHGPVKMRASTAPAHASTAATARAENEARRRIMALLSDDEVARVASAETAASLSKGDEYVDLEMPERGAQRVASQPPTPGSVLPKKAVREDTWKKIVAQLPRLG